MRWRDALSEAKETHWPLRKLGWGERTKVVTRCKSGSSGSRLVLLPGLGRAGSSSQETTETTEQGEVPNQTTGLGGQGDPPPSEGKVGAPPAPAGNAGGQARAGGRGAADPKGDRSGSDK